MAELEEKPTQERVVQLKNEANLKYSLKNYNDAAELYSRATEMQSELLGDEMAPENAELLYLYGRCLYKVAVAKSDVLGGQVAGEKKKAPKAEKSNTDNGASPAQQLAEDVVHAAVEEKQSRSTIKDEKPANQPFFQLVDAEWSDEEEDDDGEDEVQEVLEDEDDFATAYEILDLARVLLERQMRAKEESDQSAGKGKSKSDPTDISPELRQIKERLADTHDLQAEISLENEKFDEAMTDFQAAADLRDQLFPQSASIVAEAHYKLSLALEFESMAAVRAAQAQEGEPGMVKADERPEVNEELRERARKETAIAVESIKLRIEEEEKSLASLSETEARGKKKEIEDVKEILKEMEDRLKELHAPAVTINGPNNAFPADDAMSGILAQVLGESTAEQKARIQEAAKNANDLSGLVKKKKAKPTNGASASGISTASSNGSTKRKLDETMQEGDGKRAKTEELTEAP